MSPGAPRALLPVLVGIVLVTAIISSLGAPLLPEIADEFDVPVDAAQWSLTVALLTGAIGAPTIGRLGDGPYRRETIMAVLLAVVAGSIVAGLAPSLGVLLVGRGLQGLGLALAPIAMAAARDNLPAGRVPAAIATLAVTGAAGGGLGYVASGVVAQLLGLDAAFFFGGVLAGCALLAAVLVVPSSRTSGRVALDLPGAVVLSGGLVALLLAIGQGERWGWTSTVVLALVAAAVVLIAGWAWSSLRRPAPLINLRLLRHRAVLAADLATLCLGTALYIALTVITSFAQAPTQSDGFGVGVIVAGCMLLPPSLIAPFGGRLVEPLRRRVGVRVLLAGGALVYGTALGLFVVLHDALWQMFLMTTIMGIGFGLTFAAIPGLIARSVPAHETGSAMGLFQVLRSVGFAVGSALCAAVLAAHTAPGARDPDVSGYTTAMWLASGLCVLAAVAAAVLARDEPVTVTPAAGGRAGAQRAGGT